MTKNFVSYRRGGGGGFFMKNNTIKVDEILLLFVSLGFSPTRFHTFVTDVDVVIKCNTFRTLVWFLGHGQVSIAQD